MNFVSIFSKKVQIAGIEVNDSNVRLVSLGLDKRTRSPFALNVATVPLAPGIIVGSTVKNTAALAKALKTLVVQGHFYGNYAIGSIPMAEVYSKVFTFPQSVSGQKLQDAMGLASDFQNPLSAEQGYSDWEILEHSPDNEALLMALPKHVTNGYIEAFTMADIKLIALETHPQSLCRTLDVKPGDALLFTHPQRTSTSFCVLKHKSLRLCTSVEGELSKPAISEHELRIQHAFESSADTLKAKINLAKAPLVKPFSQDTKFKNTMGTYAIALGAAVRGLAPRSSDTAISLLPVGTEEAYEFQRASVVSEFIGNISVALALFFCVAYLGTWGFMSRLQASVQTQLSSSLSLTPPVDAPAVELQAKEFNQIATTAAQLISMQPQWNVVMQKVSARMVPGITITSLSFPSPNETLALSGTADSRASLVALRKSFDESPDFTEISLPLTNLDLKEKIPFSITWKIKDPTSVYPQ